jgi:hypothetical protein
MRNPGRLEARSRTMADYLQQYLKIQSVSWGSLAQDVLSRPL